MIFTNGPRDTVRAAFERYTQTSRGVLLASPFFSNSNLVREIVGRKCSVKLVVRLSTATNPDDLREVAKLNVPMRHFTSSRFHAKIYIFGDEVALVGSANLTDSGVQSNREVCVGIDREDPRFDQLVQLFQAYWDEAAVLDQKILRSFKAIIADNKASNEAAIESKIISAFGDVSPGGGVRVGRPQKSKERVYLDDYRKTYQDFMTAFRKLERIYKDFNPGLFNAQFMTRMLRIASMPPKAMRCRPSEMLWMPLKRKMLVANERRRAKMPGLQRMRLASSAKLVSRT